VENPSLARSPMGMVFEAFAGGVGEWALAPLLICIALFAYSTVICWYYYGCRCLSYLSLDKSKNIYAIAFCAFLFLPSILDGEGAVYLSDMLLFIMSVPTLLCLVIHRKNIAKITRKSGLFD
jgi:AGCS family alanine or glycine:cation symporter